MSDSLGTILSVSTMVLILVVGRSRLLPAGLQISRAGLLSRALLLLGLLAAASLLTPGAAAWQYVATMLFLILAVAAALVDRTQRNSAR